MSNREREHAERVLQRHRARAEKLVAEWLSHYDRGLQKACREAGFLFRGRFRHCIRAARRRSAALESEFR